MHSSTLCLVRHRQILSSHVLSWSYSILSYPFVSSPIQSYHVSYHLFDPIQLSFLFHSIIPGLPLSTYSILYHASYRFISYRILWWRTQPFIQILWRRSKAFQELFRALHCDIRVVVSSVK